MAMKNTTYLLLGSNLGDRKKNLALAREHVSKNVGSIVRASVLYQTAAWGKTDQPAFLNQALEVQTDLPAPELLREILFGEKKLGRKRIEKWRERVIDIDILLYGSSIVDTPELKIPHPELQNRRFALAPLSEIAATVVHPVFGLTIEELLRRCPDILEAKPTDT
jgi:2-amino-4-hydroxy-6-hydroxymethyldihydropteridine diphosphokinase